MSRYLLILVPTLSLLSFSKSIQRILRAEKAGGDGRKNLPRRGLPDGPPSGTLPVFNPMPCFRPVAVPKVGRSWCRVAERTAVLR